MASSTQHLSLPTIQNWSCHNCAGCCRNHMILVTDEEKRRIENQRWSSDDGIGPEIFVRHGDQMRLASRENGACVFLDDKGLCKIHAKFGEPAKPLACRVYPYAFHPAGDKVVLSLRFSCPSVVANLGSALTAQRSDLEDLKRLVVPPDAVRIAPPPVSPTHPLDWDEILSIVDGIDQLAIDQSIALPIRLIRLDFVARMLAIASFDKVRHERVTELIEILTHASGDEVPKSIDEIAPPTSVGKAQFRLMLAQYARKDRFSSEGTSWSYRLKMVWAGLRLTRGKGMAPLMQEDLPAVAFAQIESTPSPMTSSIDELWTRYLHIKLTGLHFAGRAFHHLPLAEGLSRLLLMYPITMYLSRWIAGAQKHAHVEPADVQKALAIADHHHGYSPAMAQENFRQRGLWLMKNQQIAPLIAWMSR